MDSNSKPVLVAYTPTEMRELYKKDPELFDALAADAIRHACTGRTAEQTLKLKQMQWLIDAQLHKAKTPLERMHLMENIFYEQIYSSDGHLAKLISSWTDFVRLINGSDRAARNRAKIRLLKKEQ